MKFDPSIFKAYDIRGVYKKNLDEDLAYKIARAYSSILKRENPGDSLDIVVGNDMRISSPPLKKEIIRGLIDSGLNVVDAGLVTTPTFYFAVGYYGHSGGIQISASHNPKEWNGFKMVRAKAVPMSGETGIYEIRDIVKEGNLPELKQKGSIRELKDVAEKVVEVQSAEIEVDKIKPMKIVADAGNAMGALDLEAIAKKVNFELVRLNFELDGNFPTHVPDPLKEENLKWVKEAVVKEGADLGIATDGDGDRWFFVDEKGNPVPQPILRGLMAQIELKEHPGATVCYDIRPGRITREMIENAGGEPYVTRVGHSLIKEKMIEIGAIFGGESSGHYFYKFNYGVFEAPVVLFLKFLLHISSENKTVSEVISPYDKYHNSGEINSKVKNKKSKMEEIAKKYDDGNISRLDGITVEYDDFWFNVRPSNTEDVLRLIVEAKSIETMEEKRDELLKIIRSS